MRLSAKVFRALVCGSTFLWLATSDALGQQSLPPSEGISDSRLEVIYSRADVTVFRERISRLSRDLGLQRTALEGLAAEVLRAEPGLSFTDYVRRFEIAAPRLQEALRLLELLEASAQTEGDSISARLMASARAALDRGDLGGGEAALQQARSISRSAASRARLEDARVAALQAQIRMLTFDFVGAARFYGEAADSVPIDQPSARASYLGARAQAFWAAYQEMGDHNAGLQSISTYRTAASVTLPTGDRLVNYQLRSELCASQAILARAGVFADGPTLLATLMSVERECNSAAIDVVNDATYSSTLMEMKIVRNLGTVRSLIAIEADDDTYLEQAASNLLHARSGFEQLGERLSAADASFELAQLAYEAGAELGIDATANIQHAIDSAEYGLRLIDPTSNSLLWRRGQHTLAIAYRYSAASGNLEDLEPSIAAFREALAATPEAQAPRPISAIWIGLALAYEIGANSGRTEMRPLAVEAARNARRLAVSTSDEQRVASADTILSRLTRR